MDQLVVGALQEGAVNRDHGVHVLAGHAGRQGHAVLLGDADIEIALGEALVKFDHTRAFAHGRRDGQQRFVLLRHVAEPLAEDFRVGWRRLRGNGFCDHPSFRVERSDRVVLDRVFFSRCVPLAFFRDDVQQVGAIDFFGRSDGAYQGWQVVAVNRAEIAEPQLLKKRTADDGVLKQVFRPLGTL